MSDIFGTRNAGQPLEERVEIQALNVDLRETVMACLSGGESRSWTVGELVERFKNLGVCATRASVTASLAELGLELELSRRGACSQLSISRRLPIVVAQNVSSTRFQTPRNHRVPPKRGVSNQGWGRYSISCGPSRKLNLWRPTHVGGGL